MCAGTAFAKEYIDWYGGIANFLSHGRLLENWHKAQNICRIGTQHVLDDGILFRRRLDGVLFRRLLK